jgi:hypothetical protein
VLPTILAIVGNAVVILGGTWVLLDRFRKWVRQLVAEPVERVEAKLAQHDHAIKRNERRIGEAHHRIDLIRSQ